MNEARKSVDTKYFKSIPCININICCILTSYYKMYNTLTRYFNVEILIRYLSPDLLMLLVGHLPQL